MHGYTGRKVGTGRHSGAGVLPCPCDEYNEKNTNKNGSDRLITTSSCVSDILGLYFILSNKITQSISTFLLSPK